MVYSAYPSGYAPYTGRWGGSFKHEDQFHDVAKVLFILFIEAVLPVYAYDGTAGRIERRRNG